MLINMHKSINKLIEMYAFGQKYGEMLEKAKVS